MASDPPNPLWRVVNFGDDRRAPGTEYWHDSRPRRPVDDCLFQYTLSGKVYLRDEFGEWEAGPGDAFLCRMGEDSAYGLRPEYTQTYRCLFVNLQGAGLTEHWTAMRRRHGSVGHFGDGILASMQRLTALAAPRAATDPLVMAAEVYAFVMSLHGALRRERHARQSPVERAIDELQRDPAGPWSLKELAERYGCSREHLTREFRARTGQSPGTWLARGRLDKALRLLKETNLSVAAVAAQAGFASAHTLARHVRRATGRPPGEARGGR